MSRYLSFPNILAILYVASSVLIWPIVVSRLGHNPWLLFDSEQFQRPLAVLNNVTMGIWLYPGLVLLSLIGCYMSFSGNGKRWIRALLLCSPLFLIFYIYFWMSLIGSAY